MRAVPSGATSLTSWRSTIANGRINHAYLFSGPRGCGKTSSARILARSLNCAYGPTPTPCGRCDSCIALAPNGPGSVDVVELDAASHGGVDDTRELRDRAFYAPAQSRYRIFIVDEAHMVTTAGFNALLKIVEEPPEHLIFVFATTQLEVILFGVGVLALGCVTFLVWSWRTARWPFGVQEWQTA